MPSNKVLEEKKKIVDRLTNEFKQAQSIVFADYRGLSVEQDTAMRVALRKGGVCYQVIKNTLSGRALKEAGIQGVDDCLKGPTAIAYSTTDVVITAKILKEYADKFDQLTIKGGVFEGKMISVDEVGKLALIPSKDVLYSQVVFGLVAPIASLAMIIHAIREKAASGTADAEALPAAVISAS
jgi:large subunit ribosomal protein L10